jgi:hypothetical protein
MRWRHMIVAGNDQARQWRVNRPPCFDRSRHRASGLASTNDHGAARWRRWQKRRDHPCRLGARDGSTQQRAQETPRVDLRGRHGARH